MIFDDNDKTGGPAYPAMEVRTHDTGDIVSSASQGLTIRDHLAGQAVVGLIGGRSWNSLGGDAAVINAWASGAYAVADAMLRVRALPIDPIQPEEPTC